jgi:DNA-binding response OmpR family regulator
MDWKSISLCHANNKKMKTSILIIADDLDLVELITSYITDENHKIIPLHLMHNGVDQIRTEKPDIVLLDMDPPGLDGFEICSKIRQFSKVPILALSAKSSSEEAVRILNYGADDFLQKPTNPQVLLAHINNLVRRAKLSGANSSHRLAIEDQSN